LREYSSARVATATVRRLHYATRGVPRQRAEEIPMSGPIAMRVGQSEGSALYADAVKRLWTLCLVLLGSGCMDAASQTPARQLVAEHAESSVQPDHESSAALPEGRVAALPALPVVPVTTPYARPVNPFADAAFFLDDDYVHNVESMFAAAPAEVPKLEAMRKYATGLWVDSTARIERITPWLDAAEQQARDLAKPVVPVFVLYNLPDRNCAAKASSGELLIERGGERRYREEFVDVISDLFAQASDPTRRRDSRARFLGESGDESERRRNARAPVPSTRIRSPTR
jgi:hypothetical protein